MADEGKPGAEFDAVDKRIIRAFQICMPAMAAETAEAVMVALINDDAHYPQRTHNEIVKLFIAAGHRNAMEMKDAVYALLEYADVLDAAREMKDPDLSEKAPSQETVLVAKVKSRGSKAPRHQAHEEKDMGQQARGQKALLTLGLALSELARQPKPRKTKTTKNGFRR